MILDRPWALALLVLPALLLWLRLRAQRPRDAEASSLLVWQRVSPSDTAPARPRPPLSAWLEAAGAALLVLGIAEPIFEGPVPAESVPVILDDTPSMGAGHDRGLFPRNHRDHVFLTAVFAGKAAGVAVNATSEEDPVRAALATAAPGRVVVITDHRLPGLEDAPGRIRVIGIGKSGFNAGITAASGVLLPGDRARLSLSIEAFGAAGPVEGRLRIGTLEETITVAPGSPLELVRDVPAHGEAAWIEFQGDILEDDDWAGRWPVGGEKVRVRPGRGDGAGRILRAAVAAGAVSEDGDATDGPRDLVLLAGPAKVPRVSIRIPEAGAGTIRGAEVVATDHPFAQDVRVEPGVELGARNPGPDEAAGPPWDTVLSDLNGPIVEARFGMAPGMGDEVRPAEVRFRFAPGGSWVERDSSFVVLVKNLVDYAADGQARIVTWGVLSREETREAAEGETFGDLAEALREARRPDAASRTSLAAAILLAGAALLVAAWFATR